MADVFLSYAREDRSRAEQIARGLTAMGLEVFWDTDIPPGQTWADFIEGKLAQSQSVVVLWSQHSTKSQWVREEARMGRDKSKLIPVIIDGSAPPLGFGEVQAADLTSWQGRTSDASWTRFANAVYTAARGSAPPAQAPQQHTPQPQAPPPRPVYSALSSGPESDPSGNLSPIGYIQKCLRMYMNGKGRARRAEYWWWIAFSVAVMAIAWVLDAAMSGLNSVTGQPNFPVIYALASLATLAPGIAVLARRFHDVGLNGWLVGGALGVYALGALSAAAVPAAGILAILALIAVLVVALIPSRPGDNQYGPNPKGV